MRFTLEQSGNANRIRGWAAGALKINERMVEGTVLVSAEQLQTLPQQRIGELDEASLEPALALAPEILLIGTGAVQHFLGTALVAALARRGVGVEVMDTVAAARTYNVLVGEGRRVVAVLLPPDA